MLLLLIKDGYYQINNDCYLLLLKEGFVCFARSARLRAQLAHLQFIAVVHHRKMWEFPNFASNSHGNWNKGLISVNGGW